MDQAPILDAEQLQAALERGRELLDQVSNVGMTGDWQDLYTVVEYLTYVSSQAHPESPCQAGCSHCCEEILFRVSDGEWEAIARHLEATLPREAQERLRALVAEVYGSYMPQLEALAEGWSTQERGNASSSIEGMPTRCLFLDATGCCGIYPVRPLVCRAYGHFGVWIAQKPSMMICREHGGAFIDLMTEQGAKPLILPQFDLLYQKLRAIAKTSFIAPLPLWILRWKENQSFST